MAKSFQEQSRYRKLIYAGLIIALLTASMFYRRYVIEPRAFNLQLRAEAQGEVELTSSAVRYMLSGSRGFATCILWQVAIEKMKRHQWNQLELLVKSITKLQPNFVTPWLFQSWNLSYNVAVECDRTRDKYFYVSRGIQLLAEGERRHQGASRNVSPGRSGPPRFPGNPNMRFYIGLFYQMKIGRSDEKHAMQCLFDLSCMDPVQSNPDRYWGVESGRKVVKPKEFLEFCERHPRFVRRLHDKLGHLEPEQVLEYMKENRGVPSRFQEKISTAGAGGQVVTQLAEREDQFPILPPLGAQTMYSRFAMPDPASRFEGPQDPDFDVYSVSRAWFTYAQEPLPPVSKMGMDEPEVEDIQRQILYRKPKMAIEIFRGWPPRAAEYHAEVRAEEGWFDEDGWLITKWFDELTDRDPGEEIRVGQKEKYHGTTAWKLAFEMYKVYGEETGLYLPPEEERRLEALANKYFRKKYQVSPDQPAVPLTPAQMKEAGGEMGRSYNAHVKLNWYKSNRHMTNFPAHYHTCKVERLPEVVKARKMFFMARKQRSGFTPKKALELYEDALEDWTVILFSHPDFAALIEIQADTYETQWHYLELRQEENREKFLGLIQAAIQIGKITPLSSCFATDLPYFQLDQEQGNRLLPMREMQGPLEMMRVCQVSDPETAKKTLFAASYLGMHAPNPLTSPTVSAVARLTDAKDTPLGEWKQLCILTAKVGSSTPNLGQRWRPLINEYAVMQARSALKLTRPPAGDTEEPPSP